MVEEMRFNQRRCVKQILGIISAVFDTKNMFQHDKNEPFKDNDCEDEPSQPGLDTYIIFNNVNKVASLSKNRKFIVQNKI